ncbi:MAG: flagellar export protein FliJ [Firmicutes bacterium]|nr:flagellar export protein FliJ [Bacillota bacterium]
MSSSFRFSLQKILDLRQRLEQEAAVELGRILKLVADAEDELARQEIRRKAQLDAWRSGVQGELDISRLSLHQRGIAILDEEIEEQQALIEELQDAADKQRQSYLEARRKRRILEKHREKEMAKFRQEVLSDRQLELDDLASARFARREAVT